jgi:hypothetical protein
MSSVSLDPIRESRPELLRTTNRIDSWLNDRAITLLQTRQLVRDLGSELSGNEISEFLRALRELELAKVTYRVIDNSGKFTGTECDFYDEIPEFDEDRKGNPFEVKRDNIIQVYRFE